jgi:RimJ/RimL family protein N-acetyltransferase
LKIWYGDDAEIATWVHARIPHMPTGFANMKTIGICADDGSPRGAVVYHEYRGNDIQMSCAADSRRWLTHDILRVLFAYPFEQLGVDRVTACVPASNRHTRRFVEGIGFQVEGIMRQGFRGDDCVIYGLLRAECKWIKGENHHG